MNKYQRTAEHPIKIIEVISYNELLSGWSSASLKHAQQNECFNLFKTWFSHGTSVLHLLTLTLIFPSFLVLNQRAIPGVKHHSGAENQSVKHGTASSHSAAKLSF